MRKVLDVIWGVWKPKYFCKRDWTASIRLIRFNKSRLGVKWGIVRLLNEAHDGSLKFDERAGYTAFEPSLCQLGEEALNLANWRRACVTSCTGAALRRTGA
jgi:hypothetical protein